MTEPLPSGRHERLRLLVISHASVLPANQHVYARLVPLGWDVTVVAPARWKHGYEPGGFESRALPELNDRFIRTPVLFPGRPQRHLYRVSSTRFFRRLRPDVAFFEEETFSLSAAQWAVGALRTSTPFGVQAAENLDRPLPWPARVARTWTLRNAGFVAARSPTAGELARCWGADGEVALVPHAVPPWERPPRDRSGPFTIAYAGRLVPEKGVFDLAQAAAQLEGPIRLMFVGDGPLRTQLEGIRLPNGIVDMRTGIRHSEMNAAYAEMDVLVLPSRTTSRWVEQFGRVLVEALSCGVPVVGSNSGGIPWVIATTGGGLVFPEGDVEQLASSLMRLQRSPAERREMAERGAVAARDMFGVDAVARSLDAVLTAAVAPSQTTRRTFPPAAGSSAAREAIER